MAAGEHKISSQGKASKRASAITRALGDMISRGVPTWIFGLAFLNENPGIEAMEHLVRSRLFQIPRFRSVYKNGSFVEVDLEDIDMNYHLVTMFEDEVVSMETALEYIGGLYDGDNFDLQKPLWKYILIPSLEDGRALVINVVNHAIGDGVANIAVLYHIMDDAPKLDSQIIKEKPMVVEKKKRLPYLNWKKKLSWYLWGIKDGLTGTMDFHDPPNALRLKDVFKPSPKKNCAFTSPIPLDRIKEIKDYFPYATINDVLLAVLSMAVREYLKSKDDPILSSKDILGNYRTIRGNFPISMRNPKEPVLDEDNNTSNDFGVAAFEFPLHYKTRIDCMYMVKQQLDGLKYSPSPIIQKYAIKALSTDVLPRQMVLDRLLAANNKVTAMLSNVPGPRNEVKICGKVVDDLQFFMFSPLGLYLGLISYNGKVSMSIAMDSAIGDPKELGAFWDSEFNKFTEECAAYPGSIEHEIHFRNSTM